MKTVAIIQARMGSTRLPGKIMMKLKEKTVLNHVIERVQQSREIDEIIVATTILKEDDVVEVEAKRYGVKVFRGSSENVLERYYQAAVSSDADHIVRITSDCPLIDHKIIDDIICKYKMIDVDIMNNTGINVNERTYPRGLDVEIFPFKSLEKAFHNAYKKYQLEHVTPYIYENSNSTDIYKSDVNHSNLRLTLDTLEDYNLLEKIYLKLYHGQHNFFLDDVLNFLKNNPNLLLVNCHVEQKKI